MPLLLMDDSSDDDALLLMVMMNSMTGGLNSQSGFDSNFNMLLPLLMKDCADTDADCKKKQKNMMVMMMTMQSQVNMIESSFKKFFENLYFIYRIQYYYSNIKIYQFSGTQHSNGPQHDATTPSHG